MENNLDEGTRAWVEIMQQKLTQIHYEVLLDPQMTCIYALEMNNNTVKIGKTRNFEKRMRNIASGSGLEVINYYHTEYVHHDIASKIELACHETFSAYRVKGEFFKITFAEARAELDKYAEEITEANRKFKEETAPAIQKKYDEYLETINETADYSLLTVKETVDVPNPVEAQNQSIFNYSEVIEDIFETAKILSQDAGLNYKLCVLTVAEMMEEKYGIDLTHIKNLFPVEDPEIEYYTPTQIGKLIGHKNGTIKYSAKKVNKLLIKYGLQEKDIKGNYSLTEQGKNYGVAIPYFNNGRTGLQVKWSDKVLELF